MGKRAKVRSVDLARYLFPADTSWRLLRRAMRRAGVPPRVNGHRTFTKIEIKAILRTHYVAMGEKLLRPKQGLREDQKAFYAMMKARKSPCSPADQGISFEDSSEDTEE